MSNLKACVKMIILENVTIINVESNKHKLRVNVPSGSLTVDDTMNGISLESNVNGIFTVSSNVSKSNVIYNI